MSGAPLPVPGLAVERSRIDVLLRQAGRAAIPLCVTCLDRAATAGPDNICFDARVRASGAARVAASSTVVSVMHSLRL